MHRENFFTIYQWKASDGNQMHLSMYLILNLSKTGILLKGEKWPPDSVKVAPYHNEMGKYDYV